mgnify:CR=1 FL=1
MKKNVFAIYNIRSSKLHWYTYDTLEEAMNEVQRLINIYSGLFTVLEIVPSKK